MDNQSGMLRRFLIRPMSWVAILGMMLSLAPPAFTLEEETICGKLEHQHADVCYEMREVLSCGLETEDHIHESNCFLSENHLNCGCEEHIHTEECYPPEETQNITEPTETIAEENTEPTTEAPTEETVPETTEEQPEQAPEEFPEETELTIPTEPLAAEEPEILSLYTADAADGDIATVTGKGIRFRLFNYSLNINKTAAGTAWRPISDYFTFRNSTEKKEETPSDTVHIPAHNINADHDADGFPASHATVERNLDGGYPVLDLTRNADGSTRTDPGLSRTERSLAYLFGGVDDHAVTAFTPENTILQSSGNHYWYNSRNNAVDYDTDANRFRVRGYVERNSTTAGNGAAYGDFLPFNYTGGVELGQTEEGAPYHLNSADADYWFGMSMEVSFYQSKDGLIGDENMVFRFSGDDDVWVFVDDVLVLDLGGTHGTVDGSIDFATGQVLQYLTWGGANSTEEARTQGSDTSFPTTLKDCFLAAGKEPNGGWNENGTTFADYTEHTLTFFYLERGAAVANCSIDFRLPTLPDKSLTVTKELTAEDIVGDFIRDSLRYTFRVRRADSEGLFLKPGTGYDLLENGARVGTGTVEEDGTFSLKAGQSAQFTDMLIKGGGSTAYVVQEIMPDGLTGQYADVEYTVSGTGGVTKTEEGPETGFTAFETDTISAEQTQVVTFRNRVDISRLCRLEISKAAAEGSDFTGEEVFPIQVSLGGQLLPMGTSYQIGEEQFTVETAGIIPLKLGQKAVVLKGILSGTEYKVWEPETEGANWRPVYSGTVTPEGTAAWGPGGAEGEFPLNSTVSVTVTNASYDFSARIPITKQAMSNEKTETFSFLAHRVEKAENGSWHLGETLPGTQITATNDAVTNGSLLIGFDSTDAGVFYFRVEEESGQGNFLYDDTWYLVEITVTEGTASVTGIWKNGEAQIPADQALAFVNQRTVEIPVTKTVVGGSKTEPFSFTATVTAGDAVTVTEFVLTHGETFLLTHIPWGAEVMVTETTVEGYLPEYRVEGIHAQNISGNTVTVTADQENLQICFTNRCGYTLPKTGGRGTSLYTLGGLLQMTAAACLLYYQRKREQQTDTR